MLVVAFTLSMLGLVAGSTPASSKMTVRVDPRIELFAIVFRLAGNEEFNRSVALSPYASEVDEWFMRFKDHDAVALAKQLRDRQSISYSAIADLAVHVDAVPTLQELLPLEPRPERLDARWSPASASAFLDQLRDFVRDTRFEEFFAKHAEFYDATAERLEQVITGAQMEDWVRDFFGARATAASFTVIPSLLNGPHNYGCGVVLPDGHVELSPVVGIWKWDDQGRPLFGADHIFTIVHEFTHNFTNPVIDRHEEELERSGRTLFATVETVMREQAYTSWKIMLYESLVRACVVRYIAKHEGEKSAVEHAQADAKRGFRCVGDLAQLLAQEYEPDRQRYPDLDAFAPRLVSFFAMLGK